MIDAEGAGLFASRVLVLAGVSALLAEFAARVGGGPLLLWRTGKRSSLEQFGLGLLLGWAAVGTTLLGLALTGLFSAAVIAMAVLALLLGSRATYARGLVLVRAAAEARGLGPVGLASLGVGFAPALLYLVVPEFQVDCDAYHLGAPWQYLQTHRVLLEHIPFTFQVPQQVDLTFTIPLLLGDDRLAKWMVVSFFVAASAVFIARCLRDAAKEAGWVGPLLALSGGHVLWLVTVSKSDVPAAALFVTGILLTRAGQWTLGAALLGLCMAAKLVYGPLVAVWLLCNPPPWRGIVRVGCFLALPLVPWWIKTYLATGNPFYPFGYAWIPSLDWGPENKEAFLSYVRPIWLSNTTNLLELSWAWMNNIRGDHLLLLLALPGMMLLGRDKRATWTCVVASMVILRIGHFPRFGLPVVWLLSLLAAQELTRLKVPWRRIAFGLMAAYALSLIGLRMFHHSYWREAAVSLPATFQRYLTTRQEALQALGRLRQRHDAAHRSGSRPPRPFKVCSVGEGGTYRYPARLLFGGMLGETPLIWKLAKVSHDPAELRKKFKQLGTDLLMYNFVSAEWLEIRYHKFVWDRRTLRMYVEFLKRYLTPEIRPFKCDYFNGGFYVFRILKEPLTPPAASAWFIPGAEAVYARATALANMRRPREALQEELAVLKLLPDVAHAWNKVGHSYLNLKDFQNSYKHLKRFGEKGVMDSMNLAEYGGVAVWVGQLEVAERVLEDALPRYPEHHGLIQLHQVSLYAAKATRFLAGRRLKEAELWMHKMQEVLDQVVLGGNPAHQNMHRVTLAMALALHGEYELMTGNSRRAAEYFFESYRAAPDHPLARRRKELGERLQRRPFGTFSAPAVRR